MYDGYTEKRKQQLELVKNTIATDKCSVRQACFKLNISYQAFYKAIPARIKDELKLLKYESLKRSVLLGVPKSSTIVSKALDKVVIIEEPPYIEDVNEKLAKFPKIIYRIWKDDTLKQLKYVQLRWFIRIEIEEWYVVGYEYELGNNQYKVDQYLYGQSKLLERALFQLNQGIADKLDRESFDDLLGTITYSTTKPVVEESSKQLTAIQTTPICLPDGQYEGTVNGDQGKVFANGIPYHFALSTRLPKLDKITITISKEIGMIYL